ncbi:MAG: PE-PPE domain-containing protein [Mycobacterium sp.]|uniref:PE family protein n=1 Tax=Mycobacterium sp. TaxID=1785 RepID=UPI001EB15787|nr:PE-PPE domain-containing protein [Mycobacterium sp.]MBW0019049.1 PE-PPE domain-containing protein [Mycobacterium sp.]
MAFLTASPQNVAEAAADTGRIGAAVSEASAAAAGPTSGMAAAAADEVSAAIADMFGAYGRQYQALVPQIAAFNDQFAQLLAASGAAYSQAETAAVNALAGLLSANPGGAAPAATNVVAIAMGGSGNPIPSMDFVDGLLNYVDKSVYNVTGTITLYTPEELYPLTAVKSLPLFTSVSQGVTILDNSLFGPQGTITAGHDTMVVGYSQSAIIASLEMRNIMAMPNPPAPSQLSFTLLADPMNPNGGLLARFPGLNLPSMGLDFYGATPPNTPYQTTIYTMEYDGFADYPRYPINVLSDLNAFAGILFIHPTYPHVDPSTLPPGDIVQLPTDPAYGTHTTYYMILHPDLPLLQPLRALPVIGQPLADLVQPDLTTLVNLGYGDPNYGYSTSPANIPTAFGLFPQVDPGVVGVDLITGTQQGFGSAASDFMAEGSGVSLTGLPSSLTATQLPSPSLSATSIIHSLQTANTNVANAFSKAAAASYATLLPTADTLNAALTVIPAYDVNLFLGGIAQAAGGDPMGLVNAIGLPIAADTALVTLAGGFDALVYVSAVAQIAEAFAALVP